MIPATTLPPGNSLLTEMDLYLFNEGSHFRLYEKLGAHPLRMEGTEGVHFAVWAPMARSVSVLGDFNGWDLRAHSLFPQGESGIWAGFVPGLRPGSTRYKYHISAPGGYEIDKSDPFAFHAELPPSTASIVWDLDYEWEDDDWMLGRTTRSAKKDAMSIYEVHLGSWRRWADGSHLSYRELGGRLADYVERMGFTHVELLPITEHPFYGSWGYQTTGYFAPTSRYGTPRDFMAFVEILHRRGIGVLLDWVPSHFPTDGHGIGYFNGTHLYEHADPRKGFHPDWKSFIFNYGLGEVRSFLISSAMFWVDKYHLDGFRIDAVASMLHLDYSRKDGEWLPNEFGGRENLEAIQFLRRLNEELHKEFPGVLTIAEDSTSWPMVSRPTYVGGLGFDMKWDMGWMHDTLNYLKMDPIFRKFHHQKLTFRMMYAYSEDFVLSLSHDEVVHGKASLLGKMAGSWDQKFAHLKLLYGYMYGTPGKKLLFMGQELAQVKEWNHESQLDWHLLHYASHEGVRKWVEDLNRLYREEPAMHEADFLPFGFQWLDCHDAEKSVVSFLRRAPGSDVLILAVCNFTPVPRMGYELGVPRGSDWIEILNSEAEAYAGCGLGNMGKIEPKPKPLHGYPYSVELTLPPLGVLYFKNSFPEPVELPEPEPTDLEKQYKALVEKNLAQAQALARTEKAAEPPLKERGGAERAEAAEEAGAERAEAAEEAGAERAEAAEEAGAERAEAAEEAGAERAEAAREVTAESAPGAGEIKETVAEAEDTASTERHETKGEAPGETGDAKKDPKRERRKEKAVAMAKAAKRRRKRRRAQRRRKS